MVQIQKALKVVAIEGACLASPKISGEGVAKPLEVRAFMALENCLSCTASLAL